MSRPAAEATALDTDGHMNRSMTAFLVILVAPVPLAAQSADTAGSLMRLPDRVMHEIGCPTGGLTPLNSPYVGALDREAVEEPPRLARLGPAVRTPENLMGHSAVVRLRFVVDTAGRIEPCSMGVVSASDHRYIEPAVTTSHQAQFTPGRVGRRPVRVIVEQNVTYN